MSGSTVRRRNVVVALGAICLLLLATACVTPEGVVEEPPAVEETAAPTVPSIVTPDPAADQAYVSCIQGTVLPSAQDFVEGYALALPAAAQSATDFCSGWQAAGDMPGEVEALVLLHEECPDPTSECLVEVRKLLDLALEEMTLGVEVVEDWCQTDGNAAELPTLLGEALGRMGSAGSFLASTATKLQECAAELAQ